MKRSIIAMSVTLLCSLSAVAAANGFARDICVPITVEQAVSKIEQMPSVCGTELGLYSVDLKNCIDGAQFVLTAIMNDDQNPLRAAVNECYPRLFSRPCIQGVTAFYKLLSTNY